MLRIMTLNINYYVAKHGAWLTRRDLIQRAIQDAAPDIIALQAVEADPAFADGRDQATMLSRLLSECQHIYFQPAVNEPSGRVQGSAFLSRLPMTQTASFPLTLITGIEDTNHRAFLSASFVLASGTLHVFNAHFSWAKEQALLNVKEALPFISAFEGYGLVVGDLNNEPESDVMQQFRAAGWTDAWDALHPNDAGLTFESSQPTVRIDYALMNAALKPHLRSIQVVANQPGPGGTHASDHFGLLATFDLNPVPGEGTKVVF